MCYYSQFIPNGKYKPNKKNRGFIPPVYDVRVLYVPIGCGRCKQCRDQRARQWQVRLLEDIKDNTNGIFVTLTFNTESLIKLTWDVRNYIMVDGRRIRFKRQLEGYTLDNEICKRAVHLFNGRWRRKYKKAIRHWLVTELGGGETEHVHIHGIIYTKELIENIQERWEYGFMWPKKNIDGENINYVSERTVNYITKYINKIDFEHPEYYPKILCSPGIGRGYIKRSEYNNFKYEDTIEGYKTRTGHMIALPAYYRNKIYTEDEREGLWLNQLNKNIRYIGKEKIKANDIKGIDQLTNYYREINNQLGYGSNKKDYDRIQYEQDRRKIIQETRLRREEAQRQAKIEWNI